MVDYITNSKNRKFKKQVVTFFDRLNFGAGKLPLSGRIILVMIIFLALSLVLPWFHFTYLGKDSATYFAFSEYTGYLGYGIVISVVLIPFFLISHTKKERLRSIVPFRLSDTQAVVFIASMLLVGEIHLISILPVFQQFAQTIESGRGLLIATSSTIMIIFSSFFLSRSTKEQTREMRYLDHYDTDTAEYKSIIHGGSGDAHNGDDENMKLPI